MTVGLGVRYPSDAVLGTGFAEELGEAPLLNGGVEWMPISRASSRSPRSNVAVMSATGIVSPTASAGPSPIATLGSFPHRLNRTVLRTSGMQFDTGVPAFPVGPTDTAMLGNAPSSLNRAPRIAALAPFFAIGFPTAANPTGVGELANHPSRLSRWPRIAAQTQFYAGPIFLPVGPPDVSAYGWHPNRLNRRERIAARAPFFAWPLPFVATPGYGPSGSVLVVSLEAGSAVSMEWSTEVMKSWNGLEHRVSQLPGPRVSFKGTALLVDGDQRDVRSNLVSQAAQGAAFLLGIPQEEVTIASTSTGSVANVASTAMLDWARPGQRVLAVAPDGSTVLQVVVQGTTATQINLDQSLGASCGSVGARLMPLVAVYLDAQQGFARYPVNGEAWAIAARAALFGFVGVDAMGLGTSITTYNDPNVGALYVWDRGINATEAATDSVQSLADLIDLGGLVASKGSALSVDYGRDLHLRSSSIVDWQWLKLFLYSVRGRQVAFLASTGRADLVFASTFGTTLNVKKGTTYGDYMQFWNNSTAQVRLAVTKADGTTQNLFVSDAQDNGDGTISLTVDSTVTGTPTRISFLEYIRFEDDRFEVTFRGGIFDLRALARVVQQ